MKKLRATAKRRRSSRVIGMANSRPRTFGESPFRPTPGIDVFERQELFAGILRLRRQKETNDLPVLHDASDDETVPKRDVRRVAPAGSDEQATVQRYLIALSHLRRGTLGFALFRHHLLSTAVERHVFVP